MLCSNGEAGGPLARALRHPEARSVRNFIARWAGSGAAERTNYQLFPTELCDVTSSGFDRNNSIQTCRQQPTDLCRLTVFVPKAMDG
jgi:hypothetical protein